MAQPAELFVVNCLWVSGRLSPIAQLSLLTMLRQGHRVRLFSYEAVTEVPDGIERHAAGDVLPREKLLIHNGSGSPALGANIFRYHLMDQQAGLWLDTDVLLLKPMLRTGAPVYGWEGEARINNAVLYLPKGDPVLESLLAFTSSEYPIPPFFAPGRKAKVLLPRLLGRRQSVRDMKWGVFGPRALTYFTKKHRRTHLAMPPHIFYPLPQKHALGPLVAGWDIQPFIQPDSVGIHLWNELLKRPSPLRPVIPPGPPAIEPGSYLATLAEQEFGLRIATK